MDCSKNYAGFWIRLLAYIIDYTIILIIGVPLSFFDINEKAANDIIFIASIIYFVALTYKTGATWGKRILGLKVIPVKKDEKLSLFQITTRETVGKFISWFLFSIGFIMVGFTQKKQSLHDKLAQTIVIKEKKE